MNICFLPPLDSASDFKRSILTIRMYWEVKLRRIAVLVVVVVILLRRHASDKFQEAISSSRTWTFFLNCLSLKYVVSDLFRWGNVPVNQNKLRMCLHFDRIRTWHQCLKLCFFSLYIYVRYLNTVPSGLTMIEINFTRPLTSYNSSEPINSAPFSRAKSLRSPRLVKFSKFIQLWLETMQHVERFWRPFCFLRLLEKWFLIYGFL